MRTNIILCLLNIVACIWMYFKGYYHAAIICAFAVGVLAALILVEYYEASRTKKGNQEQ